MSKKKVAVIGGGISGVSMARMLDEKHEVKIFEAKEKTGGLVRCDRVAGNLYHRVGGHVFNAKDPIINEWFWSFFDKDREFLKASRNAKILLNGDYIGYPLEDYLYLLPQETVKKVVQELLHREKKEPKNFAEFLEYQFGTTLFNLYFKPYNQKIWNQQPLEEIDLAWLEGKLPMPKLEEMILHNIFRKEEEGMVHSTFYYAKENGSQFIIDRLSEGLEISTNSPLVSAKKTEGKWQINENTSESFDAIVFTGDIRTLPSILPEKNFPKGLSSLPSNGTSSLFCECDPTDISWLYLPDPTLKAHRIIYTGAFSPSNNKGTNRMTCVVEFSGKHEKEAMEKELASLPGNLRPLDSNYEANSYVIQAPGNAQLVETTKKMLAVENFHLLGRFGEWEYYNMDKAMEAAMRIKTQYFAD